MQFYLRKNELNGLSSIADRESGTAKFILITGNRKAGKTALVNEFLSGRNGVYLTITPKSSAMQLKDIANYLQKVNPEDSFTPQFENWKHLFEYFFMLGKQKTFTVVFDEFQNWSDVESKVFNDFKSVWESRFSDSKLNIIFVSFDTPFTNNLFQNSSSPLYKLPDFTMKLLPFGLLDVISIFKQKKSPLKPEEILDFYIIFGGYPKYYRLFDIFNLWDKSFEEALRILVFQPYAPLGNELKDLILNHFTRENKVYISALESIALGCNTLTCIADNINIKPTTLSKYLLELENKKQIIKRIQPVNALPEGKTKLGKYYIKSYFENFWFRFVQPDIISYETGQFDRMMENISAKFPEYRRSRMQLLLKELIHNSNGISALNEILPGNISKLGSIWNRKESVDIVALYEGTKEAIFGNIYSGVFEDSKMKKIKSGLQTFDKDFPGYNIRKMIFHGKEFTDETENMLKEKDFYFCSYNKILSDTFEAA